MRAFSHRHRRRIQGPHRWSVRTPETPPAPAPADLVVARAEDLVRDAWLETLRGECEHTEAEMRAASARCEVARRHLVAALIGRVTGAAASAHPDLEAKLTSAYIAANAHRQALAALAEELGRPTRHAARIPGGRPDRIRPGRISGQVGEGVAARRSSALRAWAAAGRRCRRIASVLADLVCGLVGPRRSKC
jgi:hypothetical protein